MKYAVDGMIGNQQIAFYGLPDSTSRMQTGFLAQAANTWWGSGEFLYCYCAAACPQFALVTLTQTLQSTGWRYDAAPIANTANLGCMVGVACVTAAVGNYFWVQVSGIVPISSTVSVAAAATFGIGAAGQAGALSSGKQVLDAKIVAPATTTIVKNNCYAPGNATYLFVPSVDGWFAGIYLSGTGIAAGTTVVDIDPGENKVTLSAATTAAVSGSVTGTYNNGTIYYNVAHLNRSMAQGQIT